MDPVKIFLSHNSKYIDLATSLKNSLHALETKPFTQLDIKISEEMEGATNWLQWIEDSVKSADIFLLLFPQSGMDMSWCNYELGRFYDGKRKIVCIKNTDIPKAPPPFQSYQSYDGDETGILKFINELFVRGTFTDNKPLNSNVGLATEDIYGKAQSIAHQLAQKFAAARLREQFYERRVFLSVSYDAANQFDPKASTIQGNPEGMKLLGFGEGESVPWSAVRLAIGDTEDWPSALERAIPSITGGALPPALPPFFDLEMLYIPVIARVQSVDDVLKEVVLIFVEANTDPLRRMLDGSLPAAMPDPVATLVKLVRMMFRARWDTLEPAYQETMKYRSPTPERCAEITRSVIADYDRLARDAQSQGIQGFDRFYGIFARELRPDVESCGDEWVQLMHELGATAAETSSVLSGRLKALRANNARWLKLAAKQLMLEVDDLG
jgi:TIR domain